MVLVITSIVRYEFADEFPWKHRFFTAVFSIPKDPGIFPSKIWTWPVATGYEKNQKETFYYFVPCAEQKNHIRRLVWNVISKHQQLLYH